MIYLQLFLNFLMIGALSFGGGYGMISLVRETVLRHGWLTEAEFLSFIAVSESTPGPLAVNMATFIGSSQSGFPGALIATLGVVLPSFFIILLIAAVLKNLMKYAGVEAFLSGVRPCVVAMILATALNMMLSTLGGIKTLADEFAPDARSILVFAVLWAVHFVWKKRTQKAPSPIGMILLAAGLGILFWGV
ncbi:chromate transporter [Faecalibacterium prausnitzii]|uniref:chromate transporter n=1 Tax=Faecalibacterium prausnitzii TaxID=853 RepID=UPI0012DFD6F4|nr:chromate transporter [Faecalibacterium prausnitzii]